MNLRTAFQSQLGTCLVAATLLATACMASASQAASAASAPTLTVKQELLAPLQAARQALVDKRYGDALAQLALTDSVAGVSAHERLLIEQMRALAAGGLGDSAVQLRAVEAALGTGLADAAARRALLKQASDAAYATRNQEATVAWTRRLLDDGAAPGVPNLRLAQSLHLLARHDEALDALRALEAASRQGRWTAPKVQWQLLEAVQLARGDEPGWMLAREQRLAGFPEPAAWAELLLRRAEQPGFDPELRLDMLRLGAHVGAWTQAQPWAELAERALLAGFSAEAQAAMERADKLGLLGPDHAELRARVAKAAASERRPPAAKLAASQKGLPAKARFNAGLDLVAAGRVDEGLELMDQALAGGLGSADADARAGLRLAAAQVMAGRAADAAPRWNDLIAHGAPEGLASLARYWQLAAGSTRPR